MDENYMNLYIFRVQRKRNRCESTDRISNDSYSLFHFILFFFFSIRYGQCMREFRFSTHERKKKIIDQRVHATHIFLVKNKIIRHAYNLWIVLYSMDYGLPSGIVSFFRFWILFWKECVHFCRQPENITPTHKKKWNWQNEAINSD